jgi:hypothetical protein
MQGQIAAMQEQSVITATEDAKLVGAAADAGLVTPEEVEAYGDEFLDVVARRAKQELTPLEERLMGKIDGLNTKIATISSGVDETARSRMLAQLDTSVPDWQKTNVDPEFLKWLQLPDPYSGGIRMELLTVAFERNDSPRVAAFFRGFLAEEAAVVPALLEPGHKTDAPASGKVPLETFAAPGRAKSAAATNAPVEKPEISRGQIAKFYTDVAAGRYKGKDEERVSLEKEIFDAQADGRIR